MWLKTGDDDLDGGEGAGEHEEDDVDDVEVGFDIVID